MTGDANAEHDKARRFRDAALPYLDDVYALSRRLMRGSAEDAVQECTIVSNTVVSFQVYRAKC
jgi:DNA-directed RNA polymerase specialized sigma24 family protein